MPNKKYELLKDEFIILPNSEKVFRIQALVPFGDIGAGEKGGYIQKESNLSQTGDAWVYGNARVFGDARVSGNAWVYGDARVSGDARVEDKVINLMFKEYSVTILKEYIAIGCQTHTYEEWKNFKDCDIAPMDGPNGIQWWHKYREIILKTWENNFAR